MTQTNTRKLTTKAPAAMKTSARSVRFSHFPLLGCLTQRNAKRHAHGRNSAEIRRFFRFSSPKSASRFQGGILGRPSGGLPVCLGGSGRHVPKTLELGTTGHQFNSPRKVRESVFANRIRKPVFRLNCVIGFSEHIVWPEAQGFMLNRPEAPVSFYVPLRKTTRDAATPFPVPFYK